MGALKMFGLGSALLWMACSTTPLDKYAVPENYPESQPGETRLRRLNGSQFQNNLQDVFGDELIVPEMS